MKLRYFIIFAFVYTIVYVFFAIDVIGMEGRGPLIFTAPLRPFGLPWLLLLVALFVSRKLTSFRNQVYFILLMFAHYLITAYYLLLELKFDSSPEGEALTRVIELRPQAVYYALAWYIFGQILIWILFIKGIWKKIKIR